MVTMGVMMGVDNANVDVTIQMVSRVSRQPLLPHIFESTNHGELSYRFGKPNSAIG
jgi:hypothetical protein